MILALLITEEILLLCNLSGFRAINQIYEGWDERELSVVYWWGYTDINWNVQKVLFFSLLISTMFTPSHQHQIFMNDRCKRCNVGESKWLGVYG